jgi:hypothetical protein
MDCVTRLGIVIVLVTGLAVGCSKPSDPANATTSNTSKTAGPANAVPAIKETDPNSNPVARAAYDFLDAMVKGDSQRASNRLTPQAMQRIIASGNQLAPPGMESATFKIGAIVDLSPGQAVAQCVITDTSQGTPHSEEMCCVLRQVDNDWRVFGIAYGTTADKPWVLSNFETGQTIPIPRQSMNALAGNRPSGGQQTPAGAPANPGAQTNIAARPAAATAPVGMPPVGAPNVNAATTSSAGLGMPAVSPQSQAPYGGQPQLPYTAQEPQGNERR